MPMEPRLSVTTESTSKTHKNTLVGVFLAVFFDMFAFALIIPVVAPLFLSEESNFLSLFGYSTKATLYGITIALFSIVQFFSLPLLGALSDRIGRKNTLKISMLGEAFSYLLAAIAIDMGSLWLFMLARLVSGGLSGVITVSYSTLADISTPLTKAKNFGIVGAAFGIAFIIGPPLGGFLSNPSISPHFSFSLPFYAGFLVCLFNLLCVFLYMRETVHNTVQTKFSLLTGIRQLRRIWRLHHLRLLFFGVFMAAFGFTFFTQFLQVYLLRRFDFGQQEIGMLLGYLGIWIVISQAGVIRLVSRYFSSKKMVLYSLPLLAISLLALVPLSASWALYCILPVIAIAQGLVLPSTTALVSDTGTGEEQGEVVSLGQSMQAFAQSFPPLIGGIIVAQGESYPLMLAVVATLVAWWALRKV